MRYARNRIYISPQAQEKIRTYKIFLAGSGIGSVIAECALRLGFENITIADGDTVEISNLNRQNYVQQDIGKNKAECIRNRLLSINSKATISIRNFYLTEGNIASSLEGHDVAVNALDFQSDVPFVFDEVCQAKGIPVLHPYNLGWASYIFIVTPAGTGLASLSNNAKGFEIAAVKHLLNGLESSSSAKQWIGGVMAKFLNEEEELSPPQLSVGCWLLAASCTKLLYRLATNAPVKSYPEFYFLDTE